MIWKRLVSYGSRYDWPARSQIYSTTDGGKPWRSYTTARDLPVIAISMFDAKTGWTAGQCGSILKLTSD